MKWLFKSTFFSFLKSKGALLILSIVVFFSSAAFTLVTSAANSFNESYGNLMNNSKVHDFVAKEKYDLNGDLKFSETSPVQKEAFTTIPNGWKIDGDMEYIYFVDDPKDKTSGLGEDFSFFYDRGTKEKLDVPMRIKLDNLNIDYDRVTGIVKSVSPRDGVFQIEVPLHPSFHYVKDSNGKNIGYKQGGNVHVPEKQVFQYEWNYNGNTKYGDSQTKSPFGESGWLFTTQKGKLTGNKKIVKTIPAHDEPANYLNGKEPTYKLSDPVLNALWHKPVSEKEYTSMKSNIGKFDEGSFLMYSSSDVNFKGQSNQVSFITGHDRNSLLKYIFSDTQKSEVNKDIVWVAPKQLSISKSLQAGNRLADANDVGLNMYLKSQISFTDLEKKIATTMSTGGYLQKANVGMVSVHPDPTTSTGIYNLLLNPVTNGDASSINTKKAIDNEINRLGFNDEFVVSGPGIDSTKNREIINHNKELISSFIKKYAEDEKRSDYESNLKSKFSNQLDFKYNRTVSISSQKNVFKLVDSIDQNQSINKLHVYEGFDFPRKYSGSEATAALTRAVDLSDGVLDGIPSMKAQTILGPKSKGYNDQIISTNQIPAIDKSKGFKWVANWNQSTAPKGTLSKMFASGIASHNIPQNAMIVDPSAFFAFVSPSYYSKHNLQPLDPDIIYSNPQYLELLQSNPGKVFDLFPNSVIKAGLVRYFVLGSAIQPDFAFPIINGANPIPNTDSQAIIQTSTYGYERGMDAYRNNEKENYFSFKFKDSVPKSDYAKIMNEVEQFSRSYMSWPQDIRIVSKADDTSETVLLAPQRIATLNKLKNSVVTVSTLVSTLMILFAAFVVVLVVKRQISSRKKNYGILLANGYSKSSIAFSNISLPLIAVFIPALLGYIVGHFMQFAFIGIFDSQWTIPIFQDSFSWISLAIISGGPILASTIFIYLIGLWELRGRVLDVIQDTPNKISAIISTNVLRVFGWMGIRSKIAISLFTTNLSKMMMITISIIMSLVTLSVGFTMLGKFGTAQSVSESAINYKFKVDLESPTIEGGLLKRITPDQIGGDWTQDPQDIMNNIMDSPDGLTASTHFHVPTDKDEKLEEDPHYLDNRIETQSLLDVSFSGQVPWDLARKTIPEGQNLQSIKQTKKFFEFGLTLPENKQILSDLKNDAKYDWAHNDDGTLREVADPQKAAYVVDAPGKDQGIGSGHKLNDAFIVPTYKQFFANTFKHIISHYEEDKEYLPYMISYRNLITDDSDETYTYLNAEFNESSLITKKTEVQKVSIIGVKEKTKMVNLTNKNIEALKVQRTDGAIPIVTNTYFNKVYQKNIGDIIEMNISNMPSRTQDLAVNNDPNRKMKFVIVGETESYNGTKIYTLQDDANKALGYDKMSSNVERFNGIFSIEDSPIIFQQLSLYSKSGYYVSTDTIVSGSKHEQAINHDMKNNGGHMKDNLGIRNDNDFYRVFSKSPYVMVWSNPDWAAMSDYSFESVLNLSSSIILLIETVGIIIAVLFIAIVTLMLIDNNKKFIATMKVLGYRSGEVSRVFARTFLPTILAAIAISIPIVFGLIVAFQILIIGFGSIYIPIAMLGWEMVVATLLIVALVGFVYWASSRQLKGTSALQAFSDE